MNIFQGMVDPGERISATLQREFGEEAMNSLESTEKEKKVMEEKIHSLFHKGEEVNIAGIIPVFATCRVVFTPNVPVFFLA